VRLRPNFLLIKFRPALVLNPELWMAVQCANHYTPLVRQFDDKEVINKLSIF